eukprot:9117010-Pyramimonas_sp.AAC.1
MDTRSHVYAPRWASANKTPRIRGVATRGPGPRGRGYGTVFRPRAWQEVQSRELQQHALAAAEAHGPLRGRLVPPAPQ